MASIDYDQLATTIIDKVGGVENIKSVSHCVTRLRFILKDNAKADTKGLKKVQGVLSVVLGAGQYQVVLGPIIFDVFDEITRNYDIELGEDVDEYHPEDLPGDDSAPVKKNALYYLNVVISFLSASLTPFITVLYGAGMIKVVLSLISFAFPAAATTSTYVMFGYLGDAPFYFMPVLVAYGAAKTLKSNPAFAIAMACMLLYPNFVALVGGTQPMDMFGIPVALVKYSGTLLPALFSAILLSYLERFFYKVIPSLLRAVFAPLCTLAVAYPIVMLLLAPLGTYIGSYVVGLFTGLYAITGGVTIGILAAVWPFIVMGGMNMLFVAPMTQLLANLGYDNFFRPAWVLHNVAEGGACFGVALRAKSKQIKSDAIAAGTGAIISGVSEPAIYGIDVRLKRPMWAVCLGGLVGGTIAGVLGAKAYTLGYSSILAIPIFGDTMLAISIAIAAAFVTAFCLTLVFGFDESGVDINKENVDVPQETDVVAPIDGGVA